jgi:hypothetical protein
MNRIHRRAAGLALTLAALAAGASISAPAFASPRIPDGSWSSQQQVPSISSTLAPAECTSGSTWYVAYTTATGGIKYAIHTTGWFPKLRTVSGAGVTPSTTSSPAITVFNGNLYVFWINSSGQIRYSDLVGKTWQPTQTVMGSSYTAESSTTPSVTVSFSQLWIAYKGHSTGNIYYTETNGTTWGPQQTALKGATSDSPAITPTGLSAAPLAFAWTTSGNAIGYGILGFLGFENLGTVPDAGTNAAPALDFMSAAPNGTMYLAWKGATTNNVFFDEVANFSDSTFGPSTWKGFATLPSNAETSTGPAIIDQGTTLNAVYKARSSGNILYETATTPTS